MFFKYTGILLLVALCVAHNGRRGGSGRSSYGRSSGCQKSNNYHKSSKNDHYHNEYHHQPRKKPVQYGEPQRQRVLTLVEDVVYTIIKPICDKEPTKYDHKHEQPKKEIRKTYIEDTRRFSEEYDDFNQRPQRQIQRPRNTEVRRSFIDNGPPDYTDEYDLPQQQPRRTNRDKFDSFKQRRIVEPNRPTNRITQTDNPKRNPASPRDKIQRVLDKTNKRSSRRDYYDEDFPNDDYPNDNFPRDRNDVRQPVQQPNQVYQQYEYSYYEDYSGFVF